VLRNKIRAKAPPLPSPKGREDKKRPLWVEAPPRPSPKGRETKKQLLWVEAPPRPSPKGRETKKQLLWVFIIFLKKEKKSVESAKKSKMFIEKKE
jgi:hypothetical protein